MTYLVATRGLPGSGKTTWAREEASKHSQVVLVSKDDLRATLHNGVWSKSNEKQVQAIRDAIVHDALTRGRSVVVHDTNLAERHMIHLAGIAKQHDAEFIVQDFTEVPVEECIKRDAARSSSVGEKVIRKMWHQFLAPKVEPYPVDPALPSAVLCDLDGTLALIGDRSPYDNTGLCINDGLNEPVALLLGAMYRDAYDIVLMSGREDCVREATEEWLDNIGIRHRALHMRATGDKRKDSIVKRELFDQHVAGKHNVTFVIDDRPQVVRMWREMGLFVFDAYQTPEVDF